MTCEVKSNELSYLLLTNDKLTKKRQTNEMQSKVLNDVVETTVVVTTDKTQKPSNLVFILNLHIPPYMLTLQNLGRLWEDCLRLELLYLNLLDTIY